MIEQFHFDKISNYIFDFFPKNIKKSRITNFWKKFKIEYLQNYLTQAFEILHVG